GPGEEPRDGSRRVPHLPKGRELHDGRGGRRSGRFVRAAGRAVRAVLPQGLCAPRHVLARWLRDAPKPWLRQPLARGRGLAVRVDGPRGPARLARRRERRGYGGPRSPLSGSGFEAPSVGGVRAGGALSFGLALARTRLTRACECDGWRGGLGRYSAVQLG